MASVMPDSGTQAAVLRREHDRCTSDEEGGTSSLPSLFHKGQLVVRNEGSVTRDYLGGYNTFPLKTALQIAKFSFPLLIRCFSL